jgi:hypothetical protein
LETFSASSKGLRTFSAEHLNAAGVAAAAVHSGICVGRSASRPALNLPSWMVRGDHLPAIVLTHDVLNRITAMRSINPQRKMFLG